MLISVDAGKDMTKTCIKDENGEYLLDSFRSRIYDMADGEVEALSNDLSKTFEVELNGNKYLVGDAGTKQEFTTSKTDDINKICQYVAITRFINPGEVVEVDLVTGCPASIYKNSVLRQEYIDNIKGSGTVEITVDGKIYKFKFNSITVRPEGSGIILLNPELFINKNTIVFDIGGQNLNISVFDNLAIDPDRMLTKNAGGITIEQTLINAFETKGIENLTNNVIRTAIINRKLKNKTIEEEVTTAVINSEINKYIETYILNELDKNAINHELYDKVFIGGTSFMIKDYLLEYFDDAVFMEDMKSSQFANAKGFYEMMAGAN